MKKYVASYLQKVFPKKMKWAFLQEVFPDYNYLINPKNFDVDHYGEQNADVMVFDNHKKKGSGILREFSMLQIIPPPRIRLYAVTKIPIAFNFQTNCADTKPDNGCWLRGVKRAYTGLASPFRPFSLEGKLPKDKSYLVCRPYLDSNILLTIAEKNRINIIKFESAQELRFAVGHVNTPFIGNLASSINESLLYEGPRIFDGFYLLIGLEGFEYSDVPTT
jgi:hypothetical protein